MDILEGNLWLRLRNFPPGVIVVVVIGFFVVIIAVGIYVSICGNINGNTIYVTSISHRFWIVFIQSN